MLLLWNRSPAEQHTYESHKTNEPKAKAHGGGKRSASKDVQQAPVGTLSSAFNFRNEKVSERG
jgi:hypothetical protein